MPSHQLKEIKYCPSCGSRDWARSQAHSWHCGRCRFTYFENSAAGVAAILLVQEEILLTVRKSDPGKGMLDLPGGFVNPGESLEGALIREIDEELDFRAHTWQYLFSFPNRYEYEGVAYHTTDAFFTTDLDDKPILTPRDDVSDTIWMPVDQIDFNAVALGSIRQAIGQLRK